MNDHQKLTGAITMALATGYTFLSSFFTQTPDENQAEPVELVSLEDIAQVKEILIPGASDQMEPEDQMHTLAIAAGATVAVAGCCLLYNRLFRSSAATQARQPSVSLALNFGGDAGQQPASFERDTSGFDSNDRNRAYKQWTENLRLAQDGNRYPNLKQVLNQLNAMGDCRDKLRNLMVVNSNLLPTQEYRDLAQRAQTVLGGKVGDINPNDANQVFADVERFFAKRQPKATV